VFVGSVDFVRLLPSTLIDRTVSQRSRCVLSLIDGDYDFSPPQKYSCAAIFSLALPETGIPPDSSDICRPSAGGHSLRPTAAGHFSRQKIAQRDDIRVFVHIPFSFKVIKITAVLH
jgi:hypothetical protein